MSRLPLRPSLLLAIAVIVAAVIFSSGGPPEFESVAPGSVERDERELEYEGAEEEGEEEKGEEFADEAIQFRSQQLQNEEGKIGRNAVVKAAEQAERLREATDSAARVAGIERGTWTPLGPGNVGGRTRALVIHPTEPQTMWAGSASGGIWKTTNGGTSWRPLDDFLANLRVATLVIDPQDPDTLYAGTGESFTKHVTDGIRGAGIFRTTDGGRTWEQLQTTNTPDWHYVNRIAIDPTDSQTLLAATNSGIWRTTDAGATPWLRPTTARVTDIDFHPTNGNLAVAGGNGAAYTTNGGGTWHNATGLPGGRAELGYARSSPNVVYASVNSSGGEVWVSTNGGQSYSRASTGYQYLAGQGEYDNALWVDPTNANVIVVGGIDLFRSLNGGATLSRISDWAAEQLQGTSVHADHHAIVSHPQFNGAGNKTVLFGNDGGVYRTGDIYAAAQTSGWQELNNNYAVTQFYSGAGNPTSGRIVGGTQDNGTPALQGGTESWASIFGGDGGYVAADPSNPNYFYGEYIWLRLFRNTNGATSRSASENIWGGSLACTKPVPYQIPDACAGKNGANFIAPFVLDPNNANRILAGGASLWRTNDARTANTATTGPQWAQIKPSVGSFISAIAVAPGNPNNIWVGHNNGLIYKTANGTAATPTWSRVDLAEMPSRGVLRLTIDPRDASQVYAMFAGFEPANLWRTTDGGGTWEVRTGTDPSELPDAPVRSLVVHPTDSNLIYVGTEVGLFASEDQGATWQVPHDGPANVSVDELFWIGSKLVAATHGRGMFSTDVDAVRPANDAFEAAEPLTGTNVTRTGDSNVGATKQPGEPDHAGNAGGASIWYRWTPSNTAEVTIDTRDSGFDTVLGVYTGDSVNALTQVAANDDESNPDILTSKVTFPATAGTTYQIAVDGFRENTTVNAGSGAVALHLSQAGPVTEALTVTRSGTGSGTVTSNPAGIDCGADCAHDYPTGTNVTLTASAAPGSTFAGWSGACSGTAATCDVVMDQARAVTATFAAAPTNKSLTVTRSGAGSGTVTSNPAGIDCGADCAHDYPTGTNVTLTASAAPGSTFAGWSGACSGTAATCDVVMDQARAVTATFTAAPTNKSLTVTRSGAGSGTVTSNPAGIDCGADCAHDYPTGTNVTLTASAAPGSTFAGWSGACSGTAATCDVVMDQARAVTATFTGGPSNDAFAGRTPLDGITGTVDGSTAGGSKEVGEPNHAGNSGGASLWFQWTAPATGQAIIDTRDSSFDTLLAVYTGDSLGALSLAASNDDESYPAVLTSQLTMPVSAGTVYKIAVDGYNDGGGAETGDFSLAWELATDSAPPSNPTLASPSHTVGQWNGDATVDVTWLGANDAETGVDGFSYAWDTNATTVPDITKEGEESATSATSPPLGDGDSHWFHLRTGDNAGNWSAAVHLGPFFVDATPPSAPAPTSPSHTPGAASADATVDVTWSPPSDAASGVDGFSLLWDPSPGTEPDTSKDAEESVTSGSSPLLGVGAHYFHVRTRDNAGNWSSAGHAGPYVIGFGVQSLSCIVPDVSGKRLAKAKAALRVAGCTIGEVSRAFSRRVGAGKVINQRPRAGSTVSAGTEVSLKVSRGRRNR